MSGLERRIKALHSKRAAGEATSFTEREWADIRRRAEASPFFDVTEAGIVCSHDGKEVTHPLQLQSEELFW